MKHLIRKNYLSRRKEISHLRRTNASEAILSSCKTLCEKKHRILSFASKSSEIDLWKANSWLAQKGKLVLPRVEGESLELYRVDCWQQLEKSRWNIWEPIPERCTKVAPKSISIALIPGLAFDQNRNRIGYGKGYYDRLLLQIKGDKVGVGFCEQMHHESLPTDSHDALLDQLYLY